MQVEYLEDDEIEDESRILLERYALERNVVIVPPVPIERIVNYLNLHQEVCDIYKRLALDRSPEDEVLGALSFRDRQIYVHREIDPEDHPWLEGRFNFTLGHEVGHWVLHRKYFEAPEQFSLFGDLRSPDIVCRKSQRATPLEWQANFFASRLLMPRRLITETWLKRASRGSALTPAMEGRLIRFVAEEFATSIQATKIRLQGLGLIGVQRSPDLGV